VRQIGYRNQRTLAGIAEIVGRGFVTGLPVHLKLHPAPANTGILFIRTDLPGHPVVPARAELVTSTQRRTTIGGGEEAITLVEHLLATLAGLRIDNCVIEIDGPEPPGLDGSAQGFVDAVTKAGVQLQSARRSVWIPREMISVTQGGATVAIHPTCETLQTAQSGYALRASYILDYGNGADVQIPRQLHSMVVGPDNFAREVSSCRTFVLEREALALRAKGVGAHLTAKDLLVFGPNGLIDNRLKFANEPARHKVLDLIGDLSLCGIDLVGHVVAYRSGHSLNVNLARMLVTRAREAGADLPEPEILPAAARRPIFPGRRRVA
jgi:UDP-3-O-acyl N-acetylglucosamine deacetylase